MPFTKEETLATIENSEVSKPLYFANINLPKDLAFVRRSKSPYEIVFALGLSKITTYITNELSQLDDSSSRDN